MLRKLAPLGAVGASVLLSTRATAAVSAHLVYVRDPSADTCPDESALRRAVERRVGYDPFFPWAKTTVVVEVASEGQAFLAHVRLVDDKNRSLGVRDLRSSVNGCAGLVDAAALAISIALELNAAGSAPLVSTEDSTPASAPASGPAPALVQTVAEPSPTPPPSEASVAGEARVPPRVAARLGGSVGVDALSVIAAAPDVVAGFDVWAAARRGVASIGLELRGDTPSDAQVAGGGRATVLFFAATLAPCAHTGPFFVCALGSVGWLHAAGADVRVPRSGSAGTIGVGPRAGVEVPLTGRLALRVRGDLLVNALRPAVSLDGPLWSLPPFSGAVGAGIAYDFP